MPIAPKSTMVHDNHAGGLNTYSSPFQLADNESPDCQNVLFDKKGMVKKIRGFSKLNATEIVADKGIYGLVSYYKHNGDKYLIAMCDTQLWKWVDPDWVSIKTGLTANEMIQASVFMDTCLIVKKSDNPMKYDGATVEDIGGTPPTSQFITHHVRRIFLAGNTTYPNRVYYSDAGDYETYGPNNYIDIEPIKGDTITGLDVVLDSVIVYTQNCIFIIDTRDSSTPADWIVKRVSTDAGCVAPYTTVTIKDNTAFLSKLGVYTLGGIMATEAYEFDQIKTGLLSEKITPNIQKINKGEPLKPVAISYDYKLWLAAPFVGSTTNNGLLIYDYILEAWTKTKGINASCFTLFQLNVGEDTLLFGNPTKGYVYKYDGCDNFDGAAIESYYKTKPFDLRTKEETVSRLKRFWRLSVLVGNTGDYNLTVGYSIDFNTSFDNTDINLSKEGSLWDVAKWDEDVWDGGAGIIIRPITMKGERGRYIQYKYENNQANQYWEVYSTILMFSIKRYYKEKGE